jgi:spore coat protein U-like protein
MGKYFRALLIAIGFGFAAPGLAQAPAALAVTATVAPTCVVLGGALNFGAYTGAAATGTGTITATCTNGSTAYVLMGQGGNPDTGAGSTDASPLRRMANGTGGFLSYGLYVASPGQTAWGNTQATAKVVAGTGLPQLLTVYGQIPDGQYGAPAGAYIDTVLVTVAF